MLINMVDLSSILTFGVMESLYRASLSKSPIYLNLNIIINKDYLKKTYRIYNRLIIAGSYYRE